jgi:hypothetical protein
LIIFLTKSQPFDTVADHFPNNIAGRESGQAWTMAILKTGKPW